MTAFNNVCKYIWLHSTIQPFHHFIKLIQMPLFNSHLISFNWIHSNHHSHHQTTFIKTRVFCQFKLNQTESSPYYTILLHTAVAAILVAELRPSRPSCACRVAVVLPRCSTRAYRPSVPWRHGTKEQRWRTASSRAHRTSHNVPIV